MRVALLAGATGLVGGQCLEQLLETPNYDRVIALTRRPLATRHAKLDQRLIDFDQLGREGTDFPAADDVFCCLGTTMKRAGSEAAFRQVDFVYVVSLAGQALARGAKQFLLVSSLGANAKSPIFYSRVKGEAEAAIAALSFEGRQIFRPSILTGERTEHRPGERAGIAVMRGMAFAMIGPLRKYRPIAAATVARAMIRVARQAPRGVNIFASNDIERLGRD
ncbi:MAG TPA: oxidoreductase [Gemmatimonadales bacterium]|nr:oxidoreductase [Gemmatimonadales bacterium]